MSDDRLKGIVNKFNRAAEEKAREQAIEREKAEASRAVGLKAEADWEKVKTTILNEVALINDALKESGFKLHCNIRDSFAALRLDSLFVRFEAKRDYSRITGELEFAADRTGRLFVSSNEWADFKDYSEDVTIESYSSDHVKGALLTFLEANAPA